MIWARKSLVHLLAILLLLTLLASALVTSVNLNLSKPAKIEAWLQQSNLYGHFVSEVIAQSKNSVGSSQQSSSISLSDSAVQQAAQSAFSPALLQKDVTIFLNSNYAWLQGKTATPSFKIDLTAAKASFAQQVGQYVTAYFSSLPVCTPSQLAQLQNIDPLMAPCRPSSISPAQEGAMAQQQIANSGNFLSNPVITAASINPNSTSSSQPYYVKVSQLPKFYQLTTKLPWIFGLAALVCAIGVIFIHPDRRKSLRRVGIMLVISGAVLVAIKFLADMALKKGETKIFNSKSVGQLQQSLTTFGGLVEKALTKTDLYFGIAFIVLGLAIFIGLFFTRNRTPKLPKLPKESAAVAATSPEKDPVADTASNLRPANRRPAMDIGSPVTKPTTAPLPAKPTTQPPKPKRPKLIQ